MNKIYIIFLLLCIICTKFAFAQNQLQLPALPAIDGTPTGDKALEQGKARNSVKIYDNTMPANQSNDIPLEQLISDLQNPDVEFNSNPQYSEPRTINNQRSRVFFDSSDERIVGDKVLDPAFFIKGLKRGGNEVTEKPNTNQVKKDVKPKLSSYQQAIVNRMLTRDYPNPDIRKPKPTEQELYRHRFGRIGELNKYQQQKQYYSQLDLLLLPAASRGDITALRSLLDSGRNIEARNQHGDTPLIFATKAGQYHSVRFLLGYGADVNAQNNNGYSALHIASHFGHNKIAALLLNHKAEPNLADIHGYTPLMIATLANNAIAIDMLMRNLANINHQDLKGNTALHLAVSKRNIQIAQLLLQNKIEPNIKNHDSYTALMNASYYGYGRIIALMLQYGASPYIKNDLGQNSIMIAQRSGYMDIASFMIQNSKKGYQLSHMPTSSRYVEPQINHNNKHILERPKNLGQVRR